MAKFETLYCNLKQYDNLKQFLLLPTCVTPSGFPAEF